MLELVNPANTVTLTWATPAPITYGTALSSTQLNAVAQTTPGTTSVSISPYYRVNAFQSDGSLFSTGGFDNAGNAFSSNLVGSSIVWNGETYSLGPANLPSAVSSTTITLPQGNFVGLSLIGAATTTGQTSQLFTVAYTDGTTANVNVSLSSWTQSMGYAGETIVSTTAYQNTGSGGRITGNVNLYGYQIPLDPAKIVQSITLPNNRNVVIVAMSLTTSSTPTVVPGSYVYTPPAGTVPAVGTVPLSVVFTATDPTFGTATKSVNLVVTKAPLTVTANNETVTFGTTVPPYTDTITGFVNGDAPSVVTGAASLTTTPASPTAPNTYTITAAQGTLAATNYSFTFVPGTLTITKANPVVTWANPSGIVFGTALSNTQLNATASVPGTFTYTPASGSVPAAGTDTLSVTFIPTNTTDYNSITQTVQIVIGQATPTITWATPGAITYGTALSALQLNATSPVVGTFAYTPAAGTVPTAGTAVLSVTFTPTDSTDYAPVTKTVNLTVNKAAPVVTWTPPTAITYGTALSGAQLDATASVPGSFAYTPAAGSVPTAGTQTLSVTFTPTDTTDYKPVTQTVSIQVNKAVLTVTAASQTVTYGTALAPYSYTITGFVNGDTQTSATSGTPSLVTTPATPVNVGTYAITTTAGGLTSSNYSFVFVNGQITINKATLTLTANNASRPYNTPNPTFTGTLTGAVNGDTFTESFTTTATTTSAVGSYPITPAAAGTNLANYTVVVNPGTLTITQVTPVITWTPASPISYGTALGAAQLDAVVTGSIAGTLVYTPASGAVLAQGPQTLSVTFTPTGHDRLQAGDGPDGEHPGEQGCSDRSLRPARRSPTGRRAPVQLHHHRLRQRGHADFSHQRPVSGHHTGAPRSTSAPMPSPTMTGGLTSPPQLQLRPSSAARSGQ